MAERPRRIAITGASRGLGRALIDQFVALGHVISGCARDTAAMEELKRQHGEPHRFEAVDVSSDDEVARWALDVIAKGPPDLLLNIAAIINRNAPLWEVPADEFSRLIDINIKGAYHVLRHFVPAMAARGEGVIVNFSSGWGRTASPEVAPYCASKWAIEGLTRALSMELPHGVAAIPLNPGVIHTDMLDSCFGRGAANYPSPQAWGGQGGAVPLGPQLRG